MMDICRVCETIVETPGREFYCSNCGSTWPVPTQKKRDLHKRELSWFAKNKKRLELSIIGTAAIVILLAAVAMTTETTVLAVI